MGGWTAADGSGVVETLRRVVEAGAIVASARQRADESCYESTCGAGTHCAAALSIWARRSGGNFEPRHGRCSADLGREGSQRSARHKKRGLVFGTRSRFTSAERDDGAHIGAVQYNAAWGSERPHCGLGDCKISGAGCAGCSARGRELGKSTADCVVRTESRGRSFGKQSAISVGGDAWIGRAVLRFFSTARVHVESQKIALRNGLHRKQLVRKIANSNGQDREWSAGVPVFQCG